MFRYHASHEGAAYRIESRCHDGQARDRWDRITVELILEKLAAGESVEQILESHPRLTREAVLAALEFAAMGCYGPTSSIRCLTTRH